MSGIVESLLLHGGSFSAQPQTVCEHYPCAQIKALKHGEEGDVRALDQGEKPVNARTVQSYLERAFGPRLPDAERALQAHI